MNSTVNEGVRGSEERKKERESSCEKSTTNTEATPPAADLEMSHSTLLD